MMLHKQELLHFKKRVNNWLMLFLKYINCAQKTVHEFLGSVQRFFLSTSSFFLMPNPQLGDGMHACCAGRVRLLFVVLSCHLN